MSPPRPHLLPSPTGEVSTDGRIARGERTRLRVAEALIGLLEAGNPRPTAKQVAQRAGVSLRLVFHHFEDMDAVYRAVVAVQGQRHWDHLRPVSATLSLSQRIERTVRQRSRLFEAIGSVRRASISVALRAPDVAIWFADSNARLRELIEETFAPEIEAARADGRSLLDTIDFLASWESWERLRTVQRLPAAAARRILVHALACVLSTSPGDAPAARTRSR